MHNMWEETSTLIRPCSEWGRWEKHRSAENIICVVLFPFVGACACVCVCVCVRSVSVHPAKTGWWSSNALAHNQPIFVYKQTLQSPPNHSKWTVEAELCGRVTKKNVGGVGEQHSALLHPRVHPGIGHLRGIPLLGIPAFVFRRSDQVESFVPFQSECAVITRYQFNNMLRRPKTIVIDSIAVGLFSTTNLNIHPQK